MSETLFELIPMLPLISRDTFWKFIFAPESRDNVRDTFFQLSSLDNVLTSDVLVKLIEILKHQNRGIWPNN